MQNDKDSQTTISFFGKNLGALIKIYFFKLKIEVDAIQKYNINMYLQFYCLVCDKKFVRKLEIGIRILVATASAI